MPIEGPYKILNIYQDGDGRSWAEVEFGNGGGVTLPMDQLPGEELTIVQGPGGEIFASYEGDQCVEPPPEALASFPAGRHDGFTIVQVNSRKEAILYEEQYIERRAQLWSDQKVCVDDPQICEVKGPQIEGAEICLAGISDEISVDASIEQGAEICLQQATPALITVPNFLSGGEVTRSDSQTYRYKSSDRDTKSAILYAGNYAELGKLKAGGAAHVHLHPGGNDRNLTFGAEISIAHNQAIDTASVQSGHGAVVWEDGSVKSSDRELSPFLSSSDSPEIGANLGYGEKGAGGERRVIAIMTAHAGREDSEPSDGTCSSRRPVVVEISSDDSRGRKDGVKWFETDLVNDTSDPLVVADATQGFGGAGAAMAMVGSHRDDGGNVASNFLSSLEEGPHERVGASNNHGDSHGNGDSDTPDDPNDPDDGESLPR